jgi:hypothetical protein
MRRQLIPLLVLVVVGAGLALAQETTTGTITGRVLDQSDAVVPGATITITSEQGTKTVVSDQRGRFMVPYLTPGPYSVRVEIQGFAPMVQDNVDVRLGQRTELVFTLQVGTIQETVTVTEASPTVDLTRSSAGGTLDSDVLQKIPVGRALSDTLYVVPGVSSSGGVGRENPSVGGASGLENQYVVDGVNVTDSGYGALGSYSIRYGSLGSGVTYDFIDEVQVKTAGYEAEFGQSSGGVINVITKSGTNDYRGSVFAYVAPDALQGDFPQVDWINGYGNTTATQESDVGISVGGPILKDRAFFFGVVNPQWKRRTYIAPAGFPLASEGEVDRNRSSFSYAAKGTFQVATNHRIDTSFFGDPSNADNGPQRHQDMLSSDTGYYSALEYGGHNQSVRYSGIMSDSWLIEASFSRSTNRFEEIPSLDEWNFTDRTVTPSRRYGGKGFYEKGQDGENLQFVAKSTHILSNQEIRYGFNFEDIAYTRAIQRTGPTFVLQNGQRTATGASVIIMPDPAFGRIYRVSRANLTNEQDTEQQYMSFFVQDQLKIGTRVNISAGLRYEQQELVGTLTDFKWDNNWAPRLGVTVDPFGEGRSKIFANFGRFYAKIPNDLAARAMGSDASTALADYFDEGLTQPIPDGVYAGNTTRHLVIGGVHAANFDPEAKSTYIQEILAGFEYEVMPEVNLGIRYIYRDLPRVLEDCGNAAMVQFITNPDVWDTVEFIITNPRDGYPPLSGTPAKFEDPIHHYHAVEVQLDKRISNNWGVFASYRWSRLRGNFEGFYRNDNGQSDPALTSLFDQPTNDPTYTEIGGKLYGFRGDIRYLGSLGAGPLPNDRPHQMKLFGTYIFDNGLTLGAGFLGGSGRPLTPLAAHPIYTNGGEMPEGPRGSGFETVDGVRKRTQFEVSVDVHLDYTFQFGGQRLSLIGDFFNLFDTTRTLRYYDRTELSAGVLNPDFGKAWEFQDPRVVRVGIRFDF